MAIQTQPTGADVTAFIDTVDDEHRRSDAHRLRALIERITGVRAAMWGPAIIGFGERSATTTSDPMMVIGFAPRKAALTIYGVYSVNRPADPLFDTLGPHSTAKGCLYIKRLDAVDEVVLEQLVREAWTRGV
jgi:hypothetical protein